MIVAETMATLLPTRSFTEVKPESGCATISTEETSSGVGACRPITFTGVPPTCAKIAGVSAMSARSTAPEGTASMNAGPE